ncbi:hypothetical protein ACTXT7_016335 [Hymenolepis weldensis]
MIVVLTACCRVDFIERKKNFTQKVESTVSKVPEVIVSSKRDVKLNETLRKNHQGCIAKVSRKKGEKRERHPEIVSAIVAEWKPES